MRGLDWTIPILVGIGAAVVGPLFALVSVAVIVWSLRQMGAHI